MNTKSQKADYRILFILVMVFLFIFAACSAYAQLSITPAYIDVQLDRGRPAGRFVISNVGDKEERYRINSQFFTFSKEGVLMRSQSFDDHSLAGWMIFNPKEFTLAPKTRRIVRFVIIPRGELRPGEYWAAMELESLNTIMTEKVDNAGRTMRVEIVPQIIVPIFGQVGKIAYSGVARDTKVSVIDKSAVLETKVWNTGNGRLLIQGKYKIEDLKGKLIEEGALGKTYILPNAERQFKANIKAEVPKGKYIVKIEYTSPQLKEQLKIETEFKINAS